MFRLITSASLINMLNLSFNSKKDFLGFLPVIVVGFTVLFTPLFIGELPRLEVSVVDAQREPALGTCADGEDNDNDGYTDTNDPECTNPAQDETTPNDPLCDDGEDNDGDGLVDTNDPMCSSSSDASESPQNNVQLENGTVDLGIEAVTPEPDERDTISENPENHATGKYDTVGFEGPVSAGTEFEFSQQIFADWNLEFNDGDMGTDAQEYARLFTEIKFFDEYGNEVASWISKGMAGYSSSDGTTEWLSDGDAYSNPDYLLTNQGNLQEAFNQTHTFTPTGAVFAEVSNYMVSDDDVEDRGMFDESDDYQQDVLIETSFSQFDLSVSSNNPPTATDDGNNTTSICSSLDPVNIDVLNNDSDPDSDSLEVTNITSQPDEGSVSIIDNGDRVEYTPPSNFTGTVTFEYEVSDGNGGTDTAEVEINVTDSGCNSSPNAVDDGSNSAEICSGNASPIDINVLNNDSDPDGPNSSLTVTSVTQPSNGSVVINDADAGILRYTPGSTGEATFDYTVVDGNGGADQATVYVGPGTCGKLTVQVEDQEGNLVSDATFAPEYDSNANGTIQGNEQLPTKTKKFTYNVPVSDTPRLSKMNEALMQNIPAGYASSVQAFDKAVEKVSISGQSYDEPDDFWYPLQDRVRTKSKLATNASTTGGGGDNPPTAALECEGSQDQAFVNDCQRQYGQYAFAANFIGDGSTDPDGDIETYDWQTQSGSIDQTTNEPVDVIQYCVDIADQSDVRDNLSLTVTDANGNSDSDAKVIRDMCPVGGGGGCSEVSVQSDFSGDQLKSFDSHFCSGDDSSARQCTRSALGNREAKTATLDISSVLDSGETAGDIIFEFGPSLNDNFVADVDCNTAADASQCQSRAEITIDSGGNRLIEISGSDSEPDPPEVKDTSDFTANVSASDTVEVTVDADASLGQNPTAYRANSIEADSVIDVQGIKLEVCQ